MDDVQDRIDTILGAIRVYDGKYKREELDAAIQLKEEITPYLIKVLEKVRENPHAYIEDEDLYDHIYGIMLLGHFKEPSVHKVIIDLFSLPDDLPDKMFGDMCTTDLPMILFNTCGGSIDLMQSLALNKSADEYCRVSACQAIAYAALAEYISREDALDFFSTLFTREEAEETSDFWGLVAIIMGDLYPNDHIELIQNAFEEGLIRPGMVGYDFFERSLKLGEEACLDKLRQDFEHRSLDDIHASMSWWACFQEKSKSTGVTQQIKIQKISEKKRASAKKKKRNQAKKSRKKNRR